MILQLKSFSAIRQLQSCLGRLKNRFEAFIIQIDFLKNEFDCFRSSIDPYRNQFVLHRSKFDLHRNEFVLHRSEFDTPRNQITGIFTQFAVESEVLDCFLYNKFEKHT